MGVGTPQTSSKSPKMIIHESNTLINAQFSLVQLVSLRIEQEMDDMFEIARRCVHFLYHTIV